MICSYTIREITCSGDLIYTVFMLFTWLGEENTVGLESGPGKLFCPKLSYDNFTQNTHE